MTKLIRNPYHPPSSALEDTSRPRAAPRPIVVYVAFVALVLSALGTAIAWMMSGIVELGSVAVNTVVIAVQVAAAHGLIRRAKWSRWVAALPWLSVPLFYLAYAIVVREPADHDTGARVFPAVLLIGMLIVPFRLFFSKASKEYFGVAPHMSHVSTIARARWLIDGLEEFPTAGENSSEQSRGE